MTEPPSCPRCGTDAEPTMTRYGIRHDCCGLWSWGGAPLADARTHEARKVAHVAFDKVWQCGATSRDIAYAMLAKRLKIPLAECHIKLMSAEMAERIPLIARTMIEYLRIPA